MKNAVIVTLAVALAVSIAVGVIAQASRTVNVEVRVWQDARDPGALWLSARAEGGSWADVGTAPVALDGLSGTGRYRYGDITLALAVPPPASCEEASLAGDCATLLAMRDELAGAGALNWSAGVALADWDGVAVSGAPRRVTGLDLSERGLSGSIPTELGNLTALQKLHLVSNRLTGGIPTQLGSLTKLEHLNLSSNQLSGSIPTELGNLAKLRTLALSGNTLTGCVPNALHEVATNDIERLNFGYCPGTTMPRSVLNPGIYYQFPHTKVIIRLPNSTHSLYWTGVVADQTGSLYCLTDRTSSDSGAADRASGMCFNERTAEVAVIVVLSDGPSGQSDTDLKALLDQIGASARLAQ